MKKLLILIIIPLILACSDKVNKENLISVYIKKEQLNFNPIGNPIIVTLKNNSNVNCHIWLMSCDNNKNFTTNNKNVFFSGIDCDKNISIRYSLKPLEEKNIKLYIITKFDSAKQNFKIGYIINNAMNTNDFNSKKYQKNKYKNIEEKIIWSNPLSI